MVIVTPVDFRVGALIEASRRFEVLFLLPLIKVKDPGAIRLTGVLQEGGAYILSLKATLLRLSANLP